MTNQEILRRLPEGLWQLCMINFKIQSVHSILIKQWNNLRKLSASRNTPPCTTFHMYSAADCIAPLTHHRQKIWQDAHSVITLRRVKTHTVELRSNIDKERPHIITPVLRENIYGMTQIMSSWQHKQINCERLPAQRVTERSLWATHTTSTNVLSSCPTWFKLADDMTLHGTTLLLHYTFC